MGKRKRPVFELVGRAVVPRRTPARPAGMHRLLVRLLAPINEMLRQKARYRGDLSAMATRALRSVDLSTVPLVALKWGQEDYCGVTILIPPKTHMKLIAASKRRSVSMNALINTALVHWFAGQGDAKIKRR